MFISCGGAYRGLTDGQNDADKQMTVDENAQEHGVSIEESFPYEVIPRDIVFSGILKIIMEELAVYILHHSMGAIPTTGRLYTIHTSGLQILRYIKRESTGG